MCKGRLNISTYTWYMIALTLISESINFLIELQNVTNWMTSYKKTLLQFSKLPVSLV